jgi:hypothetical protein
MSDSLSRSTPFVNTCLKLLILLIVNPEVDWIPGILNVFKVGVFVTATVCELFWTEIWPVSKFDISM